MAREDIDKMKSRKAAVETESTDEVSPSSRLTLEPMTTQSAFHNMVYGPQDNPNGGKSSSAALGTAAGPAGNIVKLINVSAIQESTMSFADFMEKFPLNYGYDRPAPLDKRGLELDNDALSTFTFRSMLGTGLIGTSFVISATALMTLLVLLGFIMTRMTFFVAGRRYPYEELRSMTTTGLILGGLVVVSSSVSIATALLS